MTPSLSVAAPPPQEAVTLFRAVGQTPSPSGEALCVVEAKPLTGRTHQIRVHAAALGRPVLGDVLYGAPLLARLLPRALVCPRYPAACLLCVSVLPHACKQASEAMPLSMLSLRVQSGGRRSNRLWLHSSRLAVRHPAEPRETIEFTAPAVAPEPVAGSSAAAAAAASPDAGVWGVVSAAVLRSETDCFRVSHGVGTPGGEPGVFVDSLGPALLVQADADLPQGAPAEVKSPHADADLTPSAP